MKKAHVLLILLAVLTVSCKLFDFNINDPVQSVTDQAIATLDGAIRDLESANADWEEILREAMDEIPDELQSTIAHEIDNTLQRAIAASGAEVACITDMLRDRVKEDLLRIRAELMGEDASSPQPAFCQVEYVDMAMVNVNRQNTLHIYGYNFDVNEPVDVILVNRVNSPNKSDAFEEVDLGRWLGVDTHYHMMLDLGGDGAPLDKTSQKLLIKWQGELISTVEIVQPQLAACETMEWSPEPLSPITFAPVLTAGDREFAGHGPDVTMEVRFTPADLEGRTWTLRYSMRAEEPGGDTKAFGYRDVTVTFPFPAGYMIEAYISPTVWTSTGMYTDETLTEDTVYPMSPDGPVDFFKVMGDTKGDDVEGGTQMTIFFKPITFLIRQYENCAHSP